MKNRSRKEVRRRRKEGEIIRQWGNRVSNKQGVCKETQIQNDQTEEANICKEYRWYLELYRTNCRYSGGRNIFKGHKKRTLIDVIKGQKWRVILDMLQLACHNSEIEIDQKMEEIQMTRYPEECGKKWRMEKQIMLE